MKWVDKKCICAYDGIVTINMIKKKSKNQNTPETATRENNAVTIMTTTTRTTTTNKTRKMQHEQWMALHNMCPALDTYIFDNRVWILANGRECHAENIYDVFCGATNHHEYGNVILVSIEYTDKNGAYHHDIGQILDVDAMKKMMEKSENAENETVNPEIDMETIETMNPDAVAEWMCNLYENGFYGFNKLLDALNDMVKSGKITKTAYNTISRKIYDVEKSDIDAVAYCAKTDDSGNMSIRNYIQNTWGMWSHVEIVIDDVVLSMESRDYDNNVFAIVEKIYNRMFDAGINPDNVIVTDVDMQLSTIWGVQSIVMTLDCTDNHKKPETREIKPDDIQKLDETFENIVKLIDMDVIADNTGMHMFNVAIDDILSDYTDYDVLYCACNDKWRCYRDFNKMVITTMGKYPANTTLRNLTYDVISVVNNTVFVNTYFVAVDEHGNSVGLQ